jgi:threonyl-tRNA synthetase
MKILSLHCDYIKFKPLKKALKNPEELSEERKKEQIVKEPLVILTAVEKSDTMYSVKELVRNIEDISGQVNDRKIVLYPYAHLSSNLGNPELAIKILEEAEKELKKKKFEVIRAPFGYYKEFELKVKGHPLSELSREIKINGEVKEEKITEEQRIRLLNQISQVRLDTSKLKENDHRILGQQMGLFMFHDTAPGMPYWLPRGLTVYNELIKFWREEHEKRGYQEIASPLMNKSELYKISGHWEHYKENMFIAHTDENEDYCLKPMNCPNAMLVFKMQSRSYKELPLRLSDVDRVHRFERSGTLNGLLRVRGFQQDDSHNFITEDMIGEEYKDIFQICKRFYSIFGLKYSFRLGTRPENFMGDKKTWDKAESVLKEVLKESGEKFTIFEGDGAFYGPKVDIHMKDSQGREWQMGTIQLDFQLPQRFELKYIDKEGKEKTPVVVHRVIYGSLERFIGILIEHLNGRFPTWLAPIQVRILSFTDRNEKYAKKVIEEIGKRIPNIRLDGDFRQTTVPAKVKDAEIMRIPYIIVVGDKEEKDNSIAIREKGNSKIRSSKVDKFIEEINREIRERK